ncbi:MAG: SCO family protein [Acidobacteriota bacterium]|nr:SCO family protein [Acidobacteriota bacterium]
MLERQATAMSCRRAPASRGRSWSTAEIRGGRWFNPGGWLACLLALTLLVAVGCGNEPRFEGGVVDQPKQAPPLEGINWTSEQFRLADLEGRVVVLFFGYTFCPDVCPFTLLKMKQIYAQLGDRAEELAVVYVSVDPHRDTLQKIASYVRGFDPRFYGVRLEFDELDQVIDDFDLTVQYGQPKDGPGSDSFYYVDHTGTYFLLDRQGRIRLQHPPNAKVEELLPDIKTLLDE